MPQRIQEAAASATRSGPGRILLTLITPGEGSSGFYSKEVLQQAADDKVWPRGTQSHVNHDTAVERMDRPEGDLRNLAAVLIEDAYINEAGALVAEARVGSQWRDFVEDFQEFIGASIVANAEVSNSSTGRIIERLLPGPFNRVDLVTTAGRGGRIEEVLESARDALMKEATATNTDSFLRAAVRDTHAQGDNYAWVQDHDETNVYFESSGRLYQQSYTLNGVNATLQGEPIEVLRRTEYDPVTVGISIEALKDSLVNPAGVTENKKEDATMATVQIEEAELVTLRESASRVTVLEAEAATRKDKEEAEAKEAHKIAVTAAVAEAFTDASTMPRTQAALVSEALASELTVEQAKEAAVEAAAELASASGAGKPAGIGNTIGVAEAATEPTDADILSALKGA